jgi:predicted phage-related endonuclease
MLNAEQLEARKHVIGASEVAAIMGLNKWRSAYDVWCEKTNRIDQSKVKESESANYGKLFEPVILEWAAPRAAPEGVERAAPEGFETRIARNLMISKPSTKLAANLDSLLTFSKPLSQGMHDPICYGRSPLEAKFSAMSDEWGEDGSSDVPVYYNVQLHAQMQVLGPDVREGFIALMLPGFRRIDMRLYRITRDDRAAQQCQEIADEFWDKYVQKDTPPPDCLPSVETLKALKRNVGEVRDVPEADPDVTIFMRDKDALKELEKRVEDDYRRVVTRFGDAEAIRCSYGLCTYFQTNMKGYEKKVEPYSYRRLVIGAKEK